MEDWQIDGLVDCWQIEDCRRTITVTLPILTGHS